MVRRWLRLEMEKALSGHRLVWLGGRGGIGPTLRVIVHWWLQVEMEKALGGRGLGWWRRHRWLEELSGSSLRPGQELVMEAVVSALS